MTAKKNNLTKVTQTNFGLSFASANPAEYPVAYQEELWDIARDGSALANLMGGVGQYDQSAINEAIINSLVGTMPGILLNSIEDKALFVHDLLALNGLIVETTDYWKSRGFSFANYDEIVTTTFDGVEGLIIEFDNNSWRLPFVLIPAKAILNGVEYPIVCVSGVGMYGFTPTKSLTAVALPRTTKQLVFSDGYEGEEVTYFIPRETTTIYFNVTMSGKSMVQYENTRSAIDFSNAEYVEFNENQPMPFLFDLNLGANASSGNGSQQAQSIDLSKLIDILALNGQLVMPQSYYEDLGFVIFTDSWEPEHVTISSIGGSTAWDKKWLMIPQKMLTQYGVAEVVGVGEVSITENVDEIICPRTLQHGIATIYGNENYDSSNRNENVKVYLPIVPYDTNDAWTHFNDGIDANISTDFYTEFANNAPIVNDGYISIVDFSNIYYSQPMPYLLPATTASNGSASGSQRTVITLDVFASIGSYEASSDYVEGVRMGSNYVPCSGQYDSSENYYTYDSSSYEMSSVSISSQAELEQAQETYGILYVERGCSFVIAPEAYGAVSDPIVQVWTESGEKVDCRIYKSKYGQYSETFSHLINSVGDIEISTTQTNEKLKVIIL